MEDKEFDDIIKGKADNFAGPSFDPSALASLHQQMTGMVVPPWHVRYKTELIYSVSMVALALLIFWGQRYYYQQDKQLLNQEITLLKDQLSRMDDLKNEVAKLGARPADTIKIIEIQSVPAATTLGAPTFSGGKVQRTASSTPSGMIYLGVKEDLPEEIVLWLQRQGVLITDGREVYVSDLPPLHLQKDMTAEPSFLLESVTPLWAGIETSIAPEEYPEQEHQQLDTKTVLLLEKHYQKGIGFNIAPTVEFVGSDYGLGEANKSLGGGVLVDAILSPLLSLETGAIYSQRHLSVKDNFDQMNLPDLEPNLGTLNRVEIDSKTLEVPLNLKYRIPLSASTRLTAGVGVSAMWYTRQEFEHTYQLINEDGTADSRGSVRSDSNYDNWKSYPGNINLMLGISENLQNNKILDISLFYRKGIGDKGVEQLNPNLLGLRGAYWFNIR